MSRMIQDLKMRLTATLPGADAQKKMMIQQSARYKSKITHFGIPKSYKKASVMALLYQKEQQWFTALMQRPESPSSPHSKQVSFPGGGYEVTDPNDEVTALRETEEEFGVPREQIEVLGKLTHLYIPVSNYLVQPFVGYISSVPQFCPDHKEVEEIIEIPISELLNPINRRQKTTHTAQNIVLSDVPHFYLKGKKVWGATAMILSEWVAILEEIYYPI